MRSILTNVTLYAEPRNWVAVSADALQETRATVAFLVSFGGLEWFLGAPGPRKEERKTDI